MAVERAKLSFLLSVLLYIAGIVSLYFYPKLANQTYTSENALMPMYSRAPFRVSEVQYASHMSQQLSEKKNANQAIVDALEKEGFETYVQRFQIGEAHSATDQPEWAENIYAILRATKGQGIEALALSTSFNTTQSVAPGEISSLGLSIAILSHLKKLEWRAKDMVLILSPEEHKETGLKAWIDAYHRLESAQTGFTFFSSHNQNNRFENVKHCGAIHAALNLDFQPTKVFNKITLKIEGTNGQLPNLDLINTIAMISGNLLGLTVDDGSIPDSKSEILQIELHKYPIFKQNNLPADLFTMMTNQALGIPTGNHGFWIKYHIDCVTFSLSHVKGGKQIDFSQLGTLIIGTYRSLNNILEHLHQSFYFYLLTSLKQYLSIGEYMTSFGLILAGLFFKIFLTIINFKYDYKVVHALSVTVLFHIVGVINFIFPYLVSPYKIYILPSLVLNHMLFLGAFFMAPMINKQFSSPLDRNTAFPSTTFLVPMIFITTQSLMNFSFALLAGIVIVPLGLIKSSSSVARFIPTGLLLFFLEPFTLMWLVSAILQIPYFAVIETIFTQFELYGNFWYPFVYLIYQPMIYGLLYLSFPQSNSSNKQNEPVEQN